MNVTTLRQRSWRRRQAAAGAGALVLALLVLTGCSTAAPAATSTPTKTLMPTFTPAPPTATATDVPPTATVTEIPPAATDVPTEAPTATPEPPTAGSPTATPEPPTATPQPAAARPTARPVQPTAPPAPPAAADPCANIGGDGCKFRVTSGPSTAENGGLELKLQFFFMHSGEGDQPQALYFVVIEKDGENLRIPDSARSTLGASQGPLGRYNYEYSLGVDKLPGNTVAGNYTLWVLDGNGERDSRNVTFSIGGTQGLLWMQFDQG